jgi:hypothetical protein
VKEKAACDSDDAEQGCLPDSLLRAGAREGERGKDLGKVASACFHLLDRLLSLIPSWRLRLEICLFPLSTSCSCRQHGIRGVDVDSIVHISVGPQSEKGPAERCVCVCDLGSIIFRGRVPYFSTYYCGPHERSSDEYWIGLDWTGNLEIAVLRSQPDGWYAPLDDFSKQSPTCSQMGARIACPDVARLWIPVCCAAARFAVELRVCRTPSRQDAFSSGMSSLI